MNLTPKQRREQETFNALIQEKNQGKSPIINTLPSFCDYNNDLFQEAIKHCVLSREIICEIGCGNGEIATWFALQGAQHVFGIDVSDRAIAIAKERAKINNVNHKTTFIHASGEQSTLPSHSIDTVFINVALHHLELPEALQEIHRILKKDGTLIAIEPLVRSAFAQYIRTNKLFTKLFPIRQESRDERILTSKDIACIHGFFNTVSLTSFRIFSPMLFKIKPIFHGMAKLIFWEKTEEGRRKTLNRWAQACDARLIKTLPALEYLGRYSCIVVKNPKTLE